MLVLRRRSANAVTNLLSEVISTFVLVFVVGAIFSKNVSVVDPLRDWALIWGSLVWASVFLWWATGYAINPARDLGPRIAHAILRLPERRLGLGLAPIPVMGPLIGGVLAGVLLRALAIS